MTGDRGREFTAPVTTEPSGAPRSAESRLRRWAPLPSPHPRPAATRAMAEQPIRVTVREVLDYFEKCPRCGYHAQASITTHTFPSGRADTVFQPSCALPCGWQGPRS
ncbi:hypothetical protein ACWEKT_29245 [Nocardia takedensis]